MYFLLISVTFSNSRKKFIMRDTSEVKIEKFRGSGTGILALSRGERVFFWGVGTRVGAVLSFSILVFCGTYYTI